MLQEGPRQQGEDAPRHLQAAGHVQVRHIVQVSIAGCNGNRLGVDCSVTLLHMYIVHTHSEGR